MDGICVCRLRQLLICSPVTYLWKQLFCLTLLNRVLYKSSRWTPVKLRLWPWSLPCYTHYSSLQACFVGLRNRLQDDWEKDWPLTLFLQLHWYIRGKIRKESLKWFATFSSYFLFKQLSQKTDCHWKLTFDFLLKWMQVTHSLINLQIMNIIQSFHISFAGMFLGN